MNTVLVIDDEKPTLAMFRLTLNAYGYEVLTAENGREGLEVFERERPPIVLTDIKMPGMDGIEVLRRIKQIDPKTEVIVITGHGDMDLAIKALNLDATDFINKPIQRQALEQALERAKARIQLVETQTRQVAVALMTTGVVIRVQGSITSQSEPQLREAYQEALKADTTRIVLSLDPNVSINGAGMGILTQLIMEAQKTGRDLKVCGVSESFRRVFKIVGIADLVTLYESEQEALDA
ncbi:MAG: response regulator [Syntrophobacteraceae bacterium]